jgi:hypothetical protein
MEQKRKPKYEKPEIRELGRTGDDDMRAAGLCKAGDSDAGDCQPGFIAGATCDTGSIPG